MNDSLEIPTGRLRYIAAELLSIAFKYKLTILAIALFSACVAYFVTSALPKVYQSHSVILVKPGREHVYSPEVGDRTTDLSRFRSDEIINTEAQILNSRDLKEELVDKFGVEQMYPSLFDKRPKSPSWLEQLKAYLPTLNSTDSETSSLDSVQSPYEKSLQRLEDDLTIATVKDSNVIHIYLRNERPRVAADALGTLLDFFIDKHVEIYGDSRLPRMEQTLQEFETELNDAEAALANYQQRYKVFELEEEIRLRLAQRTVLDTDLNTTNKRIKEVGEQVAALSREIAQIPEKVSLYEDTDNRHLQTARNRLLELQLKEQELLSKYSEESRRVAAVRREMESAQKFLRQADEDAVPRVRTGINNVYTQMELQIRRLRAELSALKANRDENELQLEQIKGSLPTLLVRQRELRGLERELAAKERIYDTYVKRLDEARVAASMDRERVTSVRIVQQPSVPTRSLGLRPLHKVALAGVLGLLAGLGIMFVIEYRRGVFMTAESVQWQLKLPVLASVGDVR
ncbi:MAG: Wzz/FepE/Etk N-terminal domain-containing protein [Gammaproteobacteria bacterium]|nr:Wzz/FepE/Etk N-terminal domain-containing protein [Gammaproteobacteria bacterium]